jgi:SAM-dependent methyltransferase
MPRADVGYDRIGLTYSATRRPDPRIGVRVKDALGDARSLVNVGAGSGSYEPSGMHVVAVEPSEVMIRQRPPSSPPSVQAVAERLPFADEAFDAALAVFTIHHWSDQSEGLSEMKRVARNRVLVLMSDPRVEESFWLNRDYFPAITELDRDRLSSPEEVLGRLGGIGSIIPIPVPNDCADGFCSAFWQRPDAYLDHKVRAGISYFSLIPEDVITQGLERLASDLRDGAWDRRYGHLRELRELDTGQRLVVAER